MAHAIVWFRRDLRLADNPALQAALDAGLAPIPLYIHAPDEETPWAPGAASQAWLQRSLQSLAADLEALGSRLVLRQGSSLEVLEEIIAAFEVEAVYWNRLYEPRAIARDTRVKAALQARGVHAESGNAALLVEPWTIATGAGEPYRVFTPFWRNASQRIAGQAVLPAPATLPALPAGLTGSALGQLRLAPALGWDAGFWAHWQPGEAGAAELLDAFVDGAAHGYNEQRNFPDRTGSSKLSPHLHFGEISPRQVCARILAPSRPPLAAEDQAQYLAELGWREFGHHLLFHYPHTPERNLTAKFEQFPWAPVEPALLACWQQGRTGVPLVDAGMRELWQTGWMHNRVRMVVASFLSKNLRYHWSHGARWFWDTLVDADLAGNTQGWQWSAGTGADAAPYFRIFSPIAQSERFDAHGRYIRRWLPELAALPTPALFAPWLHPQLTRELAPDYPAQPIIDLKASREAALAAYQRTR
jgi:deoxyribodipyrimidine photo-lyase